MDAPVGLPVLLPLYGHPTADPQAWRTASRLGPGVTVVARRGVSGSDPELAGAMARLRAGGVEVLGRVDTAYATRPVADLLDDVTTWAEYPAVGIFLDRVPTSPFSIGPVAVAVRAARRAGLATVVLNPGAPPDPLYRSLPARVCSFDGPWSHYLRWDAAGSRPGDGHLVHAVPADRLPEAWCLLRRRGAGFGLATDLAGDRPYDGAPSWLSAVAADPVAG
ncbi:MAG: spherulation-specific family 4 protein [Micromonosporaceae bacterium]|jgi:hypothetical protein